MVWLATEQAWRLVPLPLDNTQLKFSLIKLESGIYSIVEISGGINLSFDETIELKNIMTGKPEKTRRKPSNF
jgi:hypothetical protein